MACMLDQAMFHLGGPEATMTMTTITETDLIETIADALQYISYYHPLDYIAALGEAYEAEEGPAAKDAIAQILTNSRMCAEGHRPICQDTGIVNVFIKWGQNCRMDSQRGLQDVVDEGVRRGYGNPENMLRASIVAGAVLPVRIAKGRIATVAVNEFVFKQPVSVGDLLSFYARITRIGRTSITVNVEAWAERNPANWQVVKVTEANLTYVAIDPKGKPRELPV